MTKIEPTPTHFVAAIPFAPGIHVLAYADDMDRVRENVVRELKERLDPIAGLRPGRDIAVLLFNATGIDLDPQRMHMDGEHLYMGETPLPYLASYLVRPDVEPLHFRPAGLS